MTTSEQQNFQQAAPFAKLLGTVKAMVENSTSQEATTFDSEQWLSKWLATPQPALGGDTPFLITFPNLFNPEDTSRLGFTPTVRRSNRGPFS